MVSIKKSIDINAPLKDVFDWVQWAPNFIGFWPNLVRTVNYSQDENGLGLHETIYSMVGIELKVAAQDIEKIPNEKIVVKSDRPLTSNITWSFEEIPGGTKLVFAAEYIVPASVLQSLAERIVASNTEKDIDRLLSNVKQELERLY